MPSTPSLDAGKDYDWGRASRDYTLHRPGYPESFYDVLSAIAIGRAGQRILDLATGPGVVAIPLAQHGATVTGIDIAENQIREARERAVSAAVDVEFMVADAHDSGLPAGSFDVITASMCMHYFTPEIIIPEIRRLLADGGRFVLASLIYLPRRSPIAAATEKLILTYNPQWTGADFDEDTISAEPRWSRGCFRLQTFHRYIESIRFDEESWRGRIRACRGVGASLDPDQILAFDRDHRSLLHEMADTEFMIPHLISIHVFSPVSEVS